MEIDPVYSKSIKEALRTSLMGKELVLRNKLEELRKEKGLSQETFARVLSVSRQTISSIENGRYNPSLELAFKIAGYFNESIENIFIGQEEINNE